MFSIALVFSMTPVGAFAAPSDDLDAMGGTVVERQAGNAETTTTEGENTGDPAPAAAEVTDDGAVDEPASPTSQDDASYESAVDVEDADEATGSEDAAESASEQGDDAPAPEDEADESDPDAPAADFVESDGVEAVDVQGEEVAAETLEALDDVSAAKAEEVAEELLEPEDGFALMDDDGDDPDGDGIPRSGDGSFIESIKAKWITNDTTDDGDPDHLYIKPNGDNEQSLRLQVNYALSGEHAYEPGDITITVPAHIFKKRGSDTADYGGLVIPYPEDPSTRNDFNYKLIGDTYVITNTKRMSAATKGYIQFSIDGLTPHELVDMANSEPFDAFIEVLTHKGNTIDLRSNELTAQFDTDAQVTSASKQAYGSVERVSASQIPEAQRAKYPDETEFIKVDWYTWYKTSANTLFKVDILDLIDQNATVITEDGVARPESEFQGFVIGATSEDGTQLAKNLTSKSYSSGQSSYYYYSTAYPASQFKKDTKYTFHNKITYTLTEIDDPERVTKQTATAQTVFSFRDPIWSDPSGHFMVVKNGNDDKSQNGHDKHNYTHHKSYGTSSYSDTHLWNRSSASGWYGIYPSALNDLLAQNESSGEDGSVRISYTVDTVGYVMPWMYDGSNPEYDEDGNLISSRKSKNYTRPVTMTTSDLGPSFGRNGEKLAIGEDYEYISVEFPADPYVYYGKPHNIKPDGSWVALNAGDGTFLYTIDSDKAHWPDIKLEAQVGGAWQELGTASWKSGSFSFTPAGEGAAAQTSRIVDLPEGTENFRTTVTCQNTSTDEEANLALQAALNYDMRVNIELKSTDELTAMIEGAFEESNTPDLAVWNEARLVPEDAAGDEIGVIDNDGYDSLRGYTTDVSVYPYKTSKQTVRDVDYEKRTVTVHYTAKVEERSVINDKSTYEQAVQDNPSMAETRGIWRDLLPKGVTPDLSTITLSPEKDAWNDSNYVRRTGDRVIDARTIENYEGTGRTMLVVEVALTPTPQRYRSGDMYYYEDVPRIAFDAELGFEALRDYYGDDNRLHNVISYESSNDEMGTVDRYKGEPDDPDGGNNVSSREAFDNDAEKAAMTDLNPDRDTPSFVYAGRYTRIDILSAARTSLSKDVQVNNDGWWSDGLYYGEKEENERIVYEGGQYSYRLRMMSDDETISKDLVLYDSLENFQPGDGNDAIDVPAPHWRGTLVGVDTSQLAAKGCAPVVYYSEVPNLQLANPDDPDAAHPDNMNLANASIWTEASAYETAHGGDLSGVKAVAIDASKKADGSDFSLEPLESAVVIVNMRAPSGDEAAEALADDAKGIWGDSAQAYNNAYLTCTSVDSESLEEDPDNFVHKDYTKVGLMEYNIEATKAWDDGNDRDGIRPDRVTLRLYADGADTGKTIALPITDPETGAVSWTAAFEHIPYTNDKGEKIHYTIKEDGATTGYEASVKANSETSYTITNIHEPERISVAGTKSWMGDEGNEDARPSSIKVKLYSNGRLVQSKTVKPDADGKWAYSFDDLYKYENGEEIAYTVQEEVTGALSSYVPIVVDDVNIINIYHPFGDLAVSKVVENTSATSAEVEFPFTFAFFTGEGEDADPVTADFEYEVLDAEGNPVLDGDGNPVIGMLTRDDRTVSIKGGQTIHVKNIPEYVRYTVTEEQQPGFEQSGVTGASGTIEPNATQQARFTNTYSAKAQINLAATKTLHNRELQRAQFRFELWQVDGDGGRQLVRTASNARPGGEPSTLDDGTIASSAPVTFGALYYTQADAAAQQESGEPYRYIIEEVDNGKPGYTYDHEACTVEVSVVDNNDGTLTVTPKYLGEFGDLDNPPVFENSYAASGELVLRAWKDLQGGSLEAGKYEFELLDADGNVIDRKPNAADGSVAFDALEYDETDIGKTYNYGVREVRGSDEHVNYDDSVFGYTVEVLDNGDGTLSFNQGFATPVYSQAAPCSVCGNENGKAEFEFLDTGRWPASEVRNYHIEMNRLNGITYGGYGHLEYRGSDTAELERCMKAILDMDEDIPDGVVYYLDCEERSDPYYKIGYYCPECHGDGIGMCPECDGTGKIGGEDCASCLGTGLAREITGWDTEDGELPVFVNTLKPGLLSIEKLVADAEGADPSQEFHFKVKLIGDGIEDGERDYTISAADGQGTFGLASDEDGTGQADGDDAAGDSGGYTPLAEGESQEEPGGSDDVETDASMQLMADTILTSGTFQGVDWQITTSGKLIIGDGTEQTFTNGNTYSSTTFFPWNYKKKLYEGSYQETTCGKFIRSVSFNGTVHGTGNMYAMFFELGALRTVDLTGFDTSGVTSLNYFFGFCETLNKITGLENLDTSNVTDMHQLFYACKALPSIDVTHFDTRKVKNMGSMFQYCYALTSIDISNFDASSLTTCTGIFMDCPVLKSIKLGEDFRFVGTSSDSRTHIPTPRGDAYTGKWICEDNDLGPYTPQELWSNYDASHAGTWVWKKLPTTYTISFTAGDAAGAMADAKVEYDEAVTLPASKFYKFGSEFDHWRLASINDEEPGEEVTYADRAEIPAKTYAMGDRIVLEAVFRPLDTKVNITDGEFEFTLRGGEKATFDDLPAGTAYQVWEETPDGWVLVEQSNTSGIIEPLQTAQASFTNRYQPEVATAQFSGTKTLDGRAADAGAFTFELNETTGGATGAVTILDDGAERDAKFPLRATTLDGGFIQFPVIEYTKDDVGTHTYTIAEVKPGSNAIDYDMHSETVTVVVSDNDAGTLSAQTTVDADGDGKIVFANKTRPGTLELRKYGSPLSDANEDDVFTFRITLNNEKGLPLGESDEVDWYVKNSNTGEIVVPGDDVTAPAPVAPVVTPQKAAGIEMMVPMADECYPLSQETGQAGSAPAASGEGIFSPYALDAAASGDTSGESSARLMADAEPLVGDAYAILNSEGDLLFFRSEERLTAGPDQTVVINGEEVTGRIFTGVENTNFTSYKQAHTNTQWACHYRANNPVKTVRVATGHTIRPKSMANWFSGQDGIRRSSLESFDATGFDTSECTSMAGTFSCCYKLTELDLTSFDTANVRSMGNMFWQCSGLKSLDLSSFDTSSVTSMYRMFCGCTSLRSIDMSSFDTTRVTTMEDMFASSGISNPDFSTFDTSSVTNMSGMFYGCNNLDNPDLSHLDTSNVTNMHEMFAQCLRLYNLNLSTFDTSRVTNMSGMFSGDYMLMSLKLSQDFATSNVTNMSSMFSGCNRVVSLDLSSFDTSKAANMSDMFKNCNALSSVILSEDFSFTGANITNTSYQASLPNLSATAEYTGYWIRDDYATEPLTGDQFRDGSYDRATMFGTWIRETADNKGIVRFIGNGGSPEQTSVSSAAVPYTITTPTSSTVKRPHYAFTGWNTQADGSGDAYEGGQSLDNFLELGQTKVLYAQWEPSSIRTYKVNHYQQRANLSGYTLAASEQLEADSGATVTPEVKSYPGFTRPDPQTATVLDNDSLVVNYYYDRLVYVISFDGNGATSGHMENQTFTGGVAANLAANVFQKPGAIFTGWNTRPDGSGASYTDRQRVTALDDADDGAVTLYAQWLDNPNEALTPSSGVIYVTCRANETIVLPNLPAGTTYTIEEVELPEGWVKGYSYGESGTIQPVTTSSSNFYNYYQASGKFYLTAHKKLEGGELEEGQFSFTAQTTVMVGPPGEDEPRTYSFGTVTNGDVDTNATVLDEDGNEVDNPWVGTAPVVFGPIDTSQYSLGQRFDVIITETRGTDPTIAHDSHMAVAHVETYDKGHGELGFNITYGDGDGDEPLFTNKKAPAKLQITKQVEGATASQENVPFSFRIDLFDKSGEPLGGSYPARKYGTDMVETTMYSHTPNVGDDGAKAGDYESIPYTDVVSMPGSDSLHVSLRYSNPRYCYGPDVPGLCIWKGDVSDQIAQGFNEDFNPFTADVTYYYDQDKDNQILTDEFDIAADTITVYQCSFAFPQEGYPLYDEATTNYGYHAAITGADAESEESTVASGDTVTIAPGERFVIDGLPDGATYTVTEVEKEGWEQVSAEGDEGALAAGSTSEATFVNKNFTGDGGDDGSHEFPPASVDVMLTASKTLEGRAIEPNEFSFELVDEASGDVVQTASTVSFGGNESKIQFEPITLTSKELSYDEDAIDAYVETALSVKQGEYDAAKQAADDPSTFPSFEKWIEEETGMGLNDFIVSLETEAFGEVKPTLTRTYEVREVAGEAGGVTYDKTLYRVEVVATLEGESLVPEVKMWKIGATDDADEQVDAVTFANTYEATGTAKLSGTKSIDGRSFKEGDWATFKIEATGDNAADAPMPEEATVTVEPTSGTSIGYEFGDISYSVADIPAGEKSETFTYKVTESAFSMEGVAEGDDTVHEVTVTISDNGDGTLKVETSGNADALDFTNPYEEVVPPASEPASVNLTAAKTLDGAAPGDKQFTFTLTGTSDNAKATSLEATNDTEGNVEFAAIEYDAEGVYEYEIAETAGDDESIEYDGAKHTAKVTVTKGADNKLVATVAYDGAEAVPVFENTTKEEPPAPVKLALEATKTLDGAEPGDEQFTFTLTGTSDNAKTTSLTATNDATGKVAFDEIEYTAEGTYEYEITEAAGTDETVKYDATKHAAVVTVAKGEDNKLVATVSYDGAEAAPAFANETIPPEPETVSISVTKSWADGDDADGIRPASVTIHLLANGDDTGETLELGEANEWTAAFTGLPKADESGEAIVYTVSEDPVPGYDEPVITGDAENGFMVTNPREPQSPDEPDTPPDGDEPTPDKGTTPGDEPNSAPPSGTASSTTVKGALAKTADEAPLAPLVLLLAAGAACAVAAAARRRSR
ncbi:MAG: Spy0128 family protein [Coriobacteriales bacterium]